MFIDYLTLLLINMAAGFALLAAYVLFGWESLQPRRWVAAFGAVGFVALVFGLYMVMTWPLPGPYNILFGEMSVFFGILFLGAAFSLYWDVSLYPIGIYAFFAGTAAFILGLRISNLGLTQNPVLSSAGFVVSGLAGIFAVPFLYFRRACLLRIIAAGALVAAAVIWLITGYVAYWQHIAGFAHWTPVIMRH